MTAIEDIKVGNWVALTNFNPPKPEVPEGLVCVPMHTFTPDGTPWKVEVISLPFIILSNKEYFQTFYVPHFTFQKVSKQYADFYYQYVHQQETLLKKRNSIYGST